MNSNIHCVYTCDTSDLKLIADNESCYLESGGLVSEFPLPVGFMAQLPDATVWEVTEVGWQRAAIKSKPEKVSLAHMLDRLTRLNTLNATLQLQYNQLESDLEGWKAEKDLLMAATPRPVKHLTLANDTLSKLTTKLRHTQSLLGDVGSLIHDAQNNVIKQQEIQLLGVNKHEASVIIHDDTWDD